MKKPGVFQRIVPTEIFDTLNAITTDCDSTHQSMLDLFRLTERLNVEQGMQGIEFAEWERLYRGSHDTIYEEEGD